MLIRQGMQLADSLHSMWTWLVPKKLPAEKCSWLTTNEAAYSVSMAELLVQALSAAPVISFNA